METAWAIGAGAGLAVLSGPRAFLPLAVFMLVVRMQWTWWFHVSDTPFDFLFSGAAVIVLLALVVLEVAATRLPALAGVERLLRLPASLAAAALLAGASLAGVLPWYLYLAGAVAGALLGLLGVYVYRGAFTESGDPGPALDLSVLALSFLVMLVPPTGYLVLLLFVYLALRVRRLRRLKYKGLRVLA